MASTQEAVKRLSIQTAAPGADQTRAQLQGVTGALRDLEVASSSTEKASLSLDSKFASLERRYIAQVRAAQDYAKTVRDVNAAVQQNPALQERANALLAAAAEKHGMLARAANDNASATGLTREQLAQLGTVAKSTFTSLASGEAPLSVLTTQSKAAASAISGEAGLVKGLSGLASSAVAFLGPAGAVAAALVVAGTAAAALYEIFRTKAPTAEALLSEHARLLGVIRGSYDAATDSASKFYDQGREVTKLQLLQQQIDLQQKLTESVTKAIRPTVTQDVLTGGVDVREKFRPFRDALADLNEGWQKGTPNVRAFMDEVARIALLNPVLQKTAIELVNAVGDASKFANALQQIQDAMKLLDGGKLSGDERGRLGLPAAQRAEVSAYEMLIERTKDRIEELKVEAQTAGQTADAVIKLKLQHDAERAAKKAGVEVNQAELDVLKEELALRERLKNIAQIDADIKFDRDTIGLTAEDLQIAQRLKGAFDSVGEALKSPQAEAIRLNNTLRETKEIGASFGNDLFSGLMRGETAMKALSSAATNLINKLGSKALQNVLNGGSLFGNGDLGSLQGGLTVGAAGLAGYQSGNIFTGALGGALAGAQFGPAGAAIGGLVGALGGLIGASDKAEKELKAAQERWASMAMQVVAFNHAADNFKIGVLTGQLEQLTQQHKTLVVAALEAKDYAALNGLHETYNRGISRIVANFVSGVPVLGEFSQKAQAVRDEAKGLSEALQRIGELSAGTAEALEQGVIRQLNELRRAAENSLASDINSLQGFGWLNEINAAVAKFNDLSGQVDPNLLGTWFTLTLQKIVDGAELTGEAFQRLVTGIPMLAGYVHEFAGAVEETAQAIKRSAEEIKAAKQSYQDQLFTLAQDQSTLAGQLAVFDLQAQRAREAEIAKGGEALAELEALQAAQRYKILKDFGDRQAELAEQQAERQAQALEQAQREFDSFVRSINDFIARYLSSPDSGLSPQAQLANAQSAFSTQLALAQGGNRDALNSITSYFADLDRATKAYYASSAAGQAITSAALAQLQALPSQISPEQFIVNAIQAQTVDLVDSLDIVKAAVLTGDATTIATALVPHFQALLNPTTGLLNQAQLETKLNLPNNSLDKIFKELDGNGDGILEKSELIRVATQGVKTGTDNLPGVKTNTDTLPVQATKIAGMETSLLAMAQVSSNTASSADQLATLNNAMTVGGVAAGEALRAMRLMMVEQNLRWHPPSYQVIPTYAAGTEFHPGGRALVGELGPEIVDLPVGARVIPNHRAFGNDNGELRAALGQVVAELREIKREARGTRLASIAGHRDTIEALQGGNEVAEQALRKRARDVQVRRMGNR